MDTHTFTIEIETDDPHQTLRAISWALAGCDFQTAQAAGVKPLGALEVKSDEYPVELGYKHPAMTPEIAKYNQATLHAMGHVIKADDALKESL